jgi:hypothetical protein
MHRQLVEPARVDQERPPEVGGRRAVAGALHGDVEAVLGREADDGGDVLRIRHGDDGERLGRHGEVLRHAQPLVLGRAAGVDGSCQLGGQLIERNLGPETAGGQL